MKKIIFATDGKNFPKGAFEFVKELQQHEPILLTGAFLHAVNFEDFLPAVYSLSAGPAIAWLEEEKAINTKSMRHFEELCQRDGIEYRVHEESSDWNINDLLKETRFADLMVMSEELFCTNGNASEPNVFMQQAIHRSECPVILIPESFRPFSKIAIAYDGKEESMYALKQFCYLFPQYKDLEAKIIYFKGDNNEDIPNMPYLTEYAARHFSDLEFQKLHFNGKKYFETWVEENTDALIVAGSYSRSGLSISLHKSFVEDIIHDHRVPLFIAHK